MDAAPLEVGPTGWSGDSHGHQQVEELGVVGDSQQAGLSASMVSMMTSSPGATSMPWTRYSGLNATVSSVPSNLASRLSWAWPDVLGDRHELEAVARHRQPHRRGLAGEQLDAADRLEEHLAADGEPVRLGLRDQPLVGRELALDQHRGEPRAADLEAGLALAEPHVISPSPVSTRASSCRARDGTSTCWPSLSTVVPGRSRTASR